jgi:hypothetical protein
MVWVYAILAIIAIALIWLAFVIVKWLLILALVVAVIWLVLVLRRRLA